MTLRRDALDRGAALTEFTRRLLDEVRAVGLPALSQKVALALLVAFGSLFAVFIDCMLRPLVLVCFATLPSQWLGQSQRR